MITRQQRRNTERLARKSPSIFSEHKIPINQHKGLTPERNEKLGSVIWFKRNKKGEPKKRNDGGILAPVGTTKDN
tara:strand:- start:117 stop:341 length:225 start_codon:yes stop_codon:yes gene_type:complete